MPQNTFDFNGFRALKMNQYVKQYCKPVHIKKAKAAILFVDYKMAGKKSPFVLIPIKKAAEALLLFKQVKKDKEHLIKKTGLASLEYYKDNEGQEVLQLAVKKGGLSTALLLDKGEQFVTTSLKMKLEVQMVEHKEEEEVTENQDAASDSNPPPNRRRSRIARMRENVRNMMHAIGRADVDQLKQNIKQHKELLAEVIQQAKADYTVSAEEKEEIRELRRALQQLELELENEQQNDGKNHRQLKSLAKEAHKIVDLFKKLRIKIKRNLQDQESDQKDVKLVEKMMQRVAKFEEEYDSLTPTEQESMQRFRDPIKNKVAPALEEMLKEVFRYLKIRDRVLSRLPKDKEAVQERFAEMKAKLEAIQQSMAAN